MRVLRHKIPVLLSLKLTTVYLRQNKVAWPQTWCGIFPLLLKIQTPPTLRCRRILFRPHKMVYASIYSRHAVVSWDNPAPLWFSINYTSQRCYFVIAAHELYADLFIVRASIGALPIGRGMTSRALFKPVTKSTPSIHALRKRVRRKY